MENQKDAPKDARGDATKNFGTGSRNGEDTEIRQEDCQQSFVGASGEGDDPFNSTLTPEEEKGEKRRSNKKNLGLPPTCFVPGSQPGARDIAKEKRGTKKRGWTAANDSYHVNSSSTIQVSIQPFLKI